MTPTVRQAVIQDVERLTPLFDAYRWFYGRTGEIAAARVFLPARFTNKESTLFIAHEAETPVGFARLYPSFSSVSLARVFIPNDLFVQEQARRNKVASRLISAAATYAGDGWGPTPLALHRRNERCRSGPLSLSRLEAAIHRSPSITSLFQRDA